ncbi:carboxynorspermidine decarboxylase [Endomicrobium proavitum]|uniref:Carboxynorspermidine/carboxyspermidine decarboxylase n=1 Tax=Endomicrobium proavitum TaxID=1408281 RepID=A0A0G3WGU1_9BACT|nr:carboxynorspermidine decarboxylase [Endomicrobium proavitum]AKL97891.1 Carboxynorspermidine/carboxyspermidine decarboxylase [Endomicrobium proavitum]
MKNKIKTPYYLIDERKLLENMKKVAYVKKHSGAKSVLALKCFSTWSVFPLMSKYMDGTTSSSLYEAKLGKEKFGGETHAFSVGYSKSDINELKKFADKVIFNSASQLKRFYNDVKHLKVGVRVNPGISYSHFDLADPARKYSRLGITDIKELESVLNKIDGVMFHYNCENEDFASFSKMLDKISAKYEKVLNKVNWISLGGGLYFTKNGYPLDKFCKKLKEFSQKYNVQVYLEPGESSITQSAQLVTTVLDVVKNKKETAIVDASIEPHMLDLLIYRIPAKIAEKSGKNEYIIAGRSCLAGDIFGSYKISKKLKPGSVVRFADAAGYTMVKKNWFNGVQMPSIVVKRLNGKVELIREFSYNDFLTSLS